MLVFAALLLGIAIFYFGRPFIITLIKPLWQGENAIARGLGNLGDFFRSKDALIQENQLLRDKLVNYEALQVSLRTMEASRDDLLSRFGRSPSTSTVAAGVLSSPPRTPYDLLIVDAGEDQGVTLGDKVSLPEGGALGFVSEALANTAWVTLYTSSGVETEAILERGNVPVTLRGLGGGSLEFFLPRGLVAVRGDKLLLPGVRAELVGVVEEVDLEPTDSQMRVIGRGVRNIGSIRFVAIH